ncbi:MAG TPA: hypothetical protein VFH88_11655 [Candidatus Krumholzibacteria bacterium]|nr:hypothetical protein [Candidatus Krumholzibacteria bacterium]
MTRQNLTRTYRNAHAQCSAAATTLRSRRVLWPWMTHTVKLLLGAAAYNVFALLVVQPLLRKWFPPLKPWEHITGIFGHTRTTYDHLVPAVATAVWVVGNAFLLALMNRDLHRAEAVLPVPPAPLDPAAPAETVMPAASPVPEEVAVTD